MGADLLLTWVGVEEGREPDFDAAHKKIDELIGSELDTAAREHFAWDEDSGVTNVAASMHAAVAKLEKLWVGGSREVARIKVRGADLLLTGGMSWGEGPTDAYEVIEKVMAIPGALEAARFTGVSNRVIAGAGLEPAELCGGQARSLLLRVQASSCQSREAAFDIV